LSRPKNNRYENSNFTSQFHVLDNIYKPYGGELISVTEEGMPPHIPEISFDIEKMCSEKDEKLQRAMQKNLDDK
jgi:hypothetical protein